MNYSESGEVLEESETTHEYKYDEAGNLLKQTTYIYGTETYVKNYYYE